VRRPAAAIVLIKNAQQLEGAGWLNRSRPRRPRGGYNELREQAFPLLAADGHVSLFGMQHSGLSTRGERWTAVQSGNNYRSVRDGRDCEAGTASCQAGLARWDDGGSH
jgi:hypothetical protein